MLHTYIHFTPLYYKIRRRLSQNATAILLQNARIFIQIYVSGLPYRGEKSRG